MNKQKKSYTQPTLEVTETYIKNDISLGGKQ